MNRKLVGIIVVTAMLSIPVAIRLSGGKPKLEVETTKVIKKEIQPSILASGNFVFRQQVQLSSEVIGRVSEVLVKEGDTVKQGQVLLRLDPTLIRAEVTQQKANLRNAGVSIERAQLNVDKQQINADRNRRLAEEKFVDASRYDDAIHQLNLAKVDLKAARESMQQVTAILDQSLKRLDKTEVRAPISGTVTSVQIKVGETAVASATGIAGSSLMSIADVGSMMAEVNVDESDVARVAVAQTAKIYPAAFDGAPLIAKVEEVSMAPRLAQAGAGQSKSYVVKLKLSATQLSLRTGMTCRVEIVTGGGNKKPVLPIQAILTNSNGNKESQDIEKATKGYGYVFVVVDSVAYKKLVKLGIADDSNQEVLSGVVEGDDVVMGSARALRSLREGDKVHKFVKAKEISGNKINLQSKSEMHSSTKADNKKL